MTNKEKNKSEKALIASNLFSTLAGTAAACCGGPGLVACSTVCASSCGSLTFSFFGLSSSAFTNWMGQYWYIFLLLSGLSFGYAFYKLFIKPNCASSKTSKAIFFICFAFSSIFLIRSYLMC